jgi:acyl carrier protein
MDSENIFNEVQEIFRDIFDDNNLEINYQTNSGNIENWDSLNHINLISAIEKQFKVKFTLTELFNLTDVGLLLKLLTKKINFKN